MGYEYEEEELPIRGRLRPTTKKPSRRTTRKPRPTRPPRTTTELPLYEDYDLEDYPEYELDEDYPSVEDEQVLEEREQIESKPKFPAERLKPQRGSNIRQNFKEDKNVPSLKNLLNARTKPKGDRPRFQVPTRGRFSRPGRRNEQKLPQKEETRHPSQTLVEKDPITVRPNLPKRKPAPTESKDSGTVKETRRPSFGNSNESGSRLTASKLNAKDNTPSIIEVTTPKVIKVKTQPPIVKSKPTERKSEVTTKNSLSLSQRDQKRNELKENLLQTLLNHSKKKTEPERRTEIPNVRKDSPRKLADSNDEKKKEEQRSTGLRGSTRGRKFGRGGIPSRRGPQNELKENGKLTSNSQPKKTPEPIITSVKPKSFKDSVVENLKSLSNAQVNVKTTNGRNIETKSDRPKQQGLPAVPTKKAESKSHDIQRAPPLLPTRPSKLPKFQDTIIIPTRSPSERRGSKRPQSQRSQGQRPESQRSQGQRPQSQRAQPARPESQRSQGQSQRPKPQREQSQRTETKRTESPNTRRPPTQRPNPPRSDTERPRSSRPQSKRPGQSNRPGSKSPDEKRQEENAKPVLPLNDEERKNQKNQRNSLLKQLSKNRGEQRQTGTRNSRPPQSAQRPETAKPKKSEKKTDMSALENLFSIISSNQNNDKDSTKTVIKVTSSSSSSSSSRESSVPNVRIRPHGKKQGKRKKSTRPSNATPTPTEDPSLQNLTPQERLVKKVQETLRSGDNENEDADLVRPKSNRKKVIFRKKKTDNDQLPRSGRKLGSEGTQIKTVKVRVRRIVEPLPFPIVY